jgi:hypothetical protein
MADLAHAEQAQAAGVEACTHSKCDLAWRRWLEYLNAASLLSDPFLDVFQPEDRIHLLCAFMHAVREGRFSRGPDPNKASTAREAVDYVAQKFKAAFRPDPRTDLTGSISILIKRQTKGYQNLDPSVQHEKALPCSFYRHLLQAAITQFDVGVAHLCIGALFFAMRSCEYTKVTGTCRTKTLTLADIKFHRLRHQLGHLDSELHLANTVSITFRYQKRDERDDTITQHRTLDPTLCPVKAWAYTVRRLLLIPGSNSSTTIDTFMDPSTGQPSRFTAAGLLALYRTNARAMGEENLGFPAELIGTHSNRSAAAMAMYLNGIPTYTIMILGRWSSDAFLLYIRKQVQEFSRGVSTRMINTSSFYTIPDEAANPADPRIPRNIQNTATPSFQIGRSNNQNSIIGPRLHVFH